MIKKEIQTSIQGPYSWATNYLLVHHYHHHQHQHHYHHRHHHHHNQQIARFLVLTVDGQWPALQCNDAVMINTVIGKFCYTNLKCCRKGRGPKKKTFGKRPDFLRFFYPFPILVLTTQANTGAITKDVTPSFFTLSICLLPILWILPIILIGLNQICSSSSQSRSFLLQYLPDGDPWLPWTGCLYVLKTTILIILIILAANINKDGLLLCVPMPKPSLFWRWSRWRLCLLAHTLRWIKPTFINSSSPYFIFRHYII